MEFAIEKDDAELERVQPSRIPFLALERVPAFTVPPPQLVYPLTPVTNVHISAGNARSQPPRRRQR